MLKGRLAQKTQYGGESCSGLQTGAKNRTETDQEGAEKGCMQETEDRQLSQL